MKKINFPGNVVVYLASFPPRECGIATFSQDLVAAIDKRFNPATKSRIIALNESDTSIYNYDGRVIEQIPANSLDQYVTLAEEINSQDKVKLVNIQHEFGLFGGSWGDYLVPFLQVVKKPVVVTFHAVIAKPDDYLKKVVGLIGEKAKAIVVMNERSQSALTEGYGVPQSKIFVTPHGIPQTTFDPPGEAKAELGFGGKTVLSTFGFLSRDKGVEYAIRALPRIVREFPNILYIILGETHPLVRKHEGEAYRNFLTNEVERLGLNDHVKFYNKYLSLEEIVKYLKASDIYISPSVNLEQSVSGTLSYALGCGRPVLSTPTSYARQMVNGQNGMFIQPKNPDAIARALRHLLSDKKLVESMSQNAYDNTRHMTWPNVAAAYFNIYKKFADLESEERKLPEIKLNHLIRMTDDFGILQHSRYSKPERRSGYSLDDNARALLVSAKYHAIGPQAELPRLMTTYLNFMQFAERADGSFANIVSARRERDKTREEDTQGRAIWALGFTASCDFLPEDIVKRSNIMLGKSLKRVGALQSPRAIAFAMAGLYAYLKRFPKKNLAAAFRRLADRQMKLYAQCASPRWQWFEDQLTYSNSKLPESLYYAYDLTKEKKYLDVAEKTLAFLSKITFGGSHYSPIGEAGWYFRDRKRAYFDQQPEDTASMVETKVLAYKVTKKKHQLEDVFKAFQWFLGKNHLGQMVYDEVTGGCYDGVCQDNLNLNQGAEATVSYLLARLAVSEVYPEGRDA